MTRSNSNMHAVIEKIQRIFHERGANQYGTEAVTQLEHALQSGELAEASSAPQSLVIASMLHDIGHIFHGSELPGNYEDNLDDKHEFVANTWLKEHFGPEVADPIRLHVAAKRYLCTRQPSYEDALSPTSRKSYHDQGGPMSPEEMTSFESEPHYREALELRRWDDLAKETEKETPSLQHFLPALESCLN